MSCLLAGGVALAVAQGFTLDWTHSVARTAWRENWRVEAGTLVLVEARVKGSGAGMEPGEGAVLRGDWWIWAGNLRVPQLVLAASGATGGGWRLCTDGGCREVAARPGAPLVLAPCP